MGREQVITEAYIHDFIVLLEDQDPRIRENAYRGILNLIEFQEGQDHLLMTDSLQSFVDQLDQEPQEELLILVLQLIYKSLQAPGATEKILETNVIKKLKQLLLSKNPKIREMSCVNLAQISYIDMGKVAEIESKCVLELCKLLTDPIQAVREEASQALASLAQKNEAKHQIIEYSYFATLNDLLTDTSEQCQLNAIQCIGSVAESPEGRKKAHACLDRLNRYLQLEEKEFLHPYITKTIKIITWKP